MTRNSSPWMVAVHTSCGVRRNLSRLRLAITAVLDASDARRPVAATLAMTNLPLSRVAPVHRDWGCWRTGQVVGGGPGGGVSGGGQDVTVEPELPQRHLLEGAGASLERRQRSVELVGAALHHHRDPV